MSPISSTICHITTLFVTLDISTVLKKIDYLFMIWDILNISTGTWMWIFSKNVYYEYFVDSTNLEFYTWKNQKHGQASLSAQTRISLGNHNILSTFLRMIGQLQELKFLKQQKINKSLCIKKQTWYYEILALDWSFNNK